MYSLFKQSTVGPCRTDRPNSMDMVASAKWCVHLALPPFSHLTLGARDAWAALGDMPSEVAMEAYIEFVLEAWRQTRAHAHTDT